MQLEPQEVEQFYAVWKPLLLFVNRRVRLVPDMLPADFEGPWDVREVIKIRDAMWADDTLREAFIAENPVGLSAEDLALVESWQYRRVGVFFVLRQLKKYSIFIEDSTVYGVLGLASPVDEVVPFVPCHINAVLLPFGDRIIYDSLIASHNIIFGRGIRDGLEQTYKDAKERGDIITSLLPAEPANREERQEEDRSTNSRMLDAFRTHLFRLGLSPKVVERDLANVVPFGEEYLLNQSEPRSLREFGSEDVRGYVSQVLTSPNVTKTSQRETLTSLKRFVKFLGDTERMDYHAAEEALKILKGRG